MLVYGNRVLLTARLLSSLAVTRVQFAVLPTPKYDTSIIRGNFDSGNFDSKKHPSYEHSMTERTRHPRQSQSHEVHFILP